MRAIFLSYRRDDSEGQAGRLFDDLVKVFGENSVFMDVAAIEVGRDFRKVIDQSVATCGVLLAMIGKNWLGAKDETGRRRLDDPLDFVRLETAAALKRDIPVIPVLVQGARMPRADELPDDLKDLAYRNGVELTHARWSSDFGVLVKALRSHVEERTIAATGPSEVVTPAAAEKIPAAASVQEVEHVTPRKAPKRWLWMIAAAVLALAAAVSYLRLPKESPPQPLTLEVPPLVGKSLGAARQALGERRLAVGDIKREERSDTQENIVLNQSPDAGERVRSGSKIDLVVSVPAASTGSERPQAPSIQPSQPISAPPSGCSPTYSADAIPNYRVLFIWSTNRSVLGAEVLLDGKCQGKIQSREGASEVYLMVIVPPGNYRVLVRKRGFLAYQKNVEAAPSDQPPERTGKVSVPFDLAPI